MLVGWLMLQVFPATPPISFDLARVVPADPKCGETSAGEIVVCGTDRQSNRLTALPPTTVEPLLPKAEMRLFGKITGALVGGQRVVGGIPSNSIMATVKVPF
jgi:hypothetical protein